MEREPSFNEGFAPVIRHELVSFLGDIACSGECHMAVCKQDRHHLIYSHQGDLTEAEWLLKSHPDFILPNICREKHESIHRQFDRSEPLSDEFVRGYIKASPVAITPKKRKNINRRQR